MIENILIVVTFLFGLLGFALLLALAGIAWLALRLMRMCERYRADVRRTRAAGRRRAHDHRMPLTTKGEHGRPT